jgi:transcriptional regulator of met regulon
MLELILKSFAEQHGRTPMAGKGKKSKQRKKLVKKLAKKVIKRVKKEEKKSNDEVDRLDVKPPSPFSS